jgi:hypothetical protein
MLASRGRQTGIWKVLANYLLSTRFDNQMEIEEVMEELIHFLH